MEGEENMGLCLCGVGALCLHYWRICHTGLAPAGVGGTEETAPPVSSISRMAATELPL